MPPPAACVTDDDRITYAQTGTCVMGQCQYTASVEACAQGCDRTQRACRGGAPADAGIDAGFADAGLADAGFADAGLADAGFADAGFADAGLADTGVQDASAQQVLTTPGEHQFVVPSGIAELQVRAWGGGGQGGNQNGATGGGGGFIQGRLPVMPGETLDVWVAEGGGYNGTGFGFGDGGGASYLRRGSVDLLIAGGGGGGGSDGNSGNSMAGGRAAPVEASPGRTAKTASGASRATASR